jgi:hypothetical protein
MWRGVIRGGMCLSLGCRGWILVRRLRKRGGEEGGRREDGKGGGFG